MKKKQRIALFTAAMLGCGTLTGFAVRASSQLPTSPMVAKDGDYTLALGNGFVSGGSSATVISEAGNEINFSYSGFEERSIGFALSPEGFIKNTAVIAGLKSISVAFADVGESLTLSYGWTDSCDYYDITLDGSTSFFDFYGEAPSYLCIKNEGSSSMPVNGITLKYDCKETFDQTSDFTFFTAYETWRVRTYTGSNSYVRVPRFYQKNPITHVISSLFTSTNRKTVVQVDLPTSILVIGNDTFANCPLLTTVNLPSSLTSIQNNAFYNCPLLSSISIPDSVTTIGTTCFLLCPSLTSISLGSITSLGSQAFSKCTSLSSVTFPSTLTTIGSYAFKNCPLTSIDMPSVTSIGDYAFQGCASLKSATISGKVSLGREVFSGCTSLSSISFPVGLSSIGNSAFWNCTALSSIHLPAGLTSIGAMAFCGCTSLKTINIPSSVTTIGANAFYDCSSLTDIYCEADDATEGWSSEWKAGCDAAVHWGPAA